MFLYQGLFHEGEHCLCLVCYQYDNNNTCFPNSCNCDSKLQYTGPDYLEIRDQYIDTDTWHHRYAHYDDGNWYYSYYSEERFSWTDSLEANKDSKSYTSSSQIIEKLLGGVHLPTPTWISGYYYGFYWIGLGVVTCQDGKLHSVAASGD